ncbi:carboxypeptidase regulatory-like domain-containing protein [bacterium]|nr:carboxypeptidase regulatory-like domain-containing protein [bacterium]
MKKYLPLLLILATVAQAKFIAGVVVDAATGAPVPEARVTILDESVHTDREGRFRISFEGFGVIEVEVGERFTPFRRPVGRTEKITVALIPAVVRLGEVPVSLVDFVRDASATAPAGSDTRWRLRWDSPVRVYVDPTLEAGILSLLREAFAGPRFPVAEPLDFVRFTDEELMADVLVRGASGPPDLSLTYDPRTGRVVGGVAGVGSGTDPAKLRRFFERTLMRLHGFNPLEDGDARKALTVLGDAPGFTRLDALALAVARRLPADTEMSWYGHRLLVDLQMRRNRILALPFAVTYEDPYMSHIAAATMEEALNDYGPQFRVVLHPELLGLGRLAEQERPVPDGLIRREPIRLEEALQAARGFECRFVFWGELTNSGKNSTASFFAADVTTGEMILELHGDFSDRLHFPHFLADAGLALAREIVPRDDVSPMAKGVLRLYFTSQHSSTYVHVLVDDSLAAVLHENSGDVKVTLSPGRHRVEFRYFLPMRHLGCVVGVFAGDRAFSVDIQSGAASSVATLYGMNPAETGRAWNYAKTKIIGYTGEVELEESHDLISERKLWLDLFNLVERLRTPKGPVQE